MSNKTLPVLSAASQIKVDLKKELVPVEEWGYAVWVHEMTAGDVDAYRQPMYQFDAATSTMKLNMAEQSIRICVYAMHDEAGSRIYTDVAEGIADLSTKGAGGVAVVAKVAQRLSGITDDKSAEGNSDSGPTDSSSSD